MKGIILAGGSGTRLCKRLCAEIPETPYLIIDFMFHNPYHRVWHESCGKKKDLNNLNREANMNNADERLGMGNSGGHFPYFS